MQLPKQFQEAERIRNTGHVTVLTFILTILKIVQHECNSVEFRSCAVY